MVLYMKNNGFVDTQGSVWIWTRSSGGHGSERLLSSTSPGLSHSSAFQFSSYFSALSKPSSLSSAILHHAPVNLLPLSPTPSFPSSASHALTAWSRRDGSTRASHYSCSLLQQTTSAASTTGIASDPSWHVEKTICCLHKAARFSQVSLSTSTWHRVQSPAWNIWIWQNSERRSAFFTSVISHHHHFVLMWNLKSSFTF